jgi:CrcB protein
MSGLSFLAVFAGAGTGALLRWGLGLWLNPVFPTVPLGTLAANAIGGLLMGLLLGVFSQYESLSPALRLALTTGFLGGLTTFSTFSAETATLLLRAEYGWALAAIALHVGTSILATHAGVAVVGWLPAPSGGMA